MNDKICSCGFPQSFPIPHEHDRTNREKQIINYYKRQIKGLILVINYQNGSVARNYVVEKLNMILNCGIGFHPTIEEKLNDKEKQELLAGANKHDLNGGELQWKE